MRLIRDYQIRKFIKEYGCAFNTRMKFNAVGENPTMSFITMHALTIDDGKFIIDRMLAAKLRSICNAHDTLVELGAWERWGDPKIDVYGLRYATPGVMIVGSRIKYPGVGYCERGTFIPLHKRIGD